MKVQIEPVEQFPDVTNKPPDQPWFIPTDGEQGVYRFIIAASRRARQLQAGARPTISTTSRKPTKIAMEEVRVGAIPVEIVTAEETAAYEAIASSASPQEHEAPSARK